MTQRTRPHAWTRMVAGLAWLVVVGLGMGALWSYALAPGDAGHPPERWPEGSPIRRAPGVASLVMFVHPRCPCTRASLEELDRLMARCRGLVAARVLMFKPRPFPDAWAMTDTWRSAAAIPDVEVALDEGGAEAARFRAATSGHTILYDRDGRLLFSGGITESRGHQGDNAGVEAIVSFLTRGTADRRETYVFGCSFFDPSAGATGGS